MDGIRIILTSEDKEHLLDAIDKSSDLEKLQEDQQKIENNSLTVNELRKLQKTIKTVD